MTLFVLHLTLLVASHGERGTGEGDCLSSVQWGHSKVSHHPSSSWACRLPLTFWWTFSFSVGNCLSHSGSRGQESS